MWDLIGRRLQTSDQRKPWPHIAIYRCGSERRSVVLTVLYVSHGASSLTDLVARRTVRRGIRRLVDSDPLESRFRAKYFKVTGVGVTTHKLPESLTALQHLTSA
jgi:hypothetical protein